MIVVAAGGDADKVVIAVTPFDTLSEWCEYTREERGWDIGLYVGRSLGGDPLRSLDASTDRGRTAGYLAGGTSDSRHGNN